MRILHLLLVGLLLSVSAPLQAQQQDDEAESRMSADSGFVEVDHGRLYYEMVGTGETVVLIHGNFGDRRHWHHQVAALATAHRVLLYDVRGFGKSSLPVEGVPYSEHGDLADLLAQLTIPRAHIVGFSMGAAIATDFVLAYPDKSKSLVSVGPWVRGYSSENAEAVSKDFEALGSVVKEQGAAAAVDYAVTQTFVKETIRSAETESRLRDIISGFSWWYFKQEDSRLPLEPSAANRLDEIVVPTLIVTAEYDILACLEFADLLERRVANSRKLTFADAGHFMMIEKPEAFNRTLLDFFAAGEKD